MGFTDWDWSATGRRRARRVASSSGHTGDLTAGPVAPVRPAMGDLWWDTATKTMTVWNGMDWLEVRTGEETAPLPPSFPRPDPTMPAGSMVLVVDGSLADPLAREPDVVDAYRERMEDTAERWAAKHGFTIARGSWSTLPPVDPTVVVPLRLEAYLVPRTDGVWGEIRAAMEEDREDREEAFTAPEYPDAPRPPIVVHIEPEPV